MIIGNICIVSLSTMTVFSPHSFLFPRISDSLIYCYCYLEYWGCWFIKFLCFHTVFWQSKDLIWENHPEDIQGRVKLSFYRYTHMCINVYVPTYRVLKDKVSFACWLATFYRDQAGFALSEASPCLIHTAISHDNIWSANMIIIALLPRRFYNINIIIY